MGDITADTFRAEIETLTREAERLRITLNDTEKRRAALELSLEHFQRAGLTESETAPIPRVHRRRQVLDVSADDLRGKTLDDALVYIAQRNNGILPSTAARHLLVEAGVLRGSQPGNKLWATLDRSTRFKRESKGQYRLVEVDDQARTAIF